MTQRARPLPPLRRWLVFLGALLFLLAGSARAEAAVSWRITSLSDTAVASGNQLTYNLELKNEGAGNTDGSPVTLTAALPPGFHGVSSTSEALELPCPGIAGASTIECTGPFPVSGHNKQIFTLTVAVDPGVEGLRTTAFELEGGGANAGAQTFDPTLVSPAPAAFGFEAFDFGLFGDGGQAFSRAAGHPALQRTSFDLDTHTNASQVVGPHNPVEDLRDLTVDLPAGLLGNPAALDQCRFAQLALGDLGSSTNCPEASQVGTAFVRVDVGTFGPLPLFSMVPPPGVPARFAFDVADAVVVLDAHLRSSGDYGISISSLDTPQALSVAGTTVDFWGVPSASNHDSERDCLGQAHPVLGGPGCASDAAPAAFFREPTSCTAPGAGLPIAARIDSWQHPGAFVPTEIATHAAPGYPLADKPSLFPAGYSGPQSWGPPLGTEGCDEVPFEPTLAASLSTDRADSPAGLSVDLGLPADCWDPKATEEEALDSICQSDMREAAVTLPRGMSINPAAAGGRAACTPAQAGLSTPVGSRPIHFDEAPVGCPDASKIGTVEIQTPLLGRHDAAGKPVTDEAGRPLPEPLTGSVYLAQQGQNPFGSLLAMYLVAEGSGVIVKQAGEIEVDPDGRITTSFHETPQTPFSKIHVDLFGGSRAPLRSPVACGTYTATAKLTPWSGNAPVDLSSSFQITQGCGGGFDPKLSAGTQNPLAGRYSPFSLRLSREDGSQEIGSLSATLPEGLIGKPAGIPYCPDAVVAGISGALGTGAGQEASPSCPAGSRLGTVTVGAGAGPNPFYTQAGQAYLAGPYKGAPLSLAVVAPAVAGPFDLGSVVVRNALRINPESAQVSAVSDPLPTILHGIPLDLRAVRIDLNRPGFTLNPTSCEPMAITSTVTSTQGAVAHPSSHFQAAGCDRLGFKPKLSLKLGGGTRRSDHPALTAVLRPRKGDANIGRVQVALPHSEFLAQNHIRTVCTRVQFAAGGGGGAQCPKGSVYGKVTATSPLVDYPLHGNVYLRSSANPLPDMVLALRGPATQPLEVDAVGRIDSVKGGIRTTFATVPDAPLTKVVLRMPGGKKSLLENSRNLCKAKNWASVQMDAHNGKVSDFAAPLKAKCANKGKRVRHERDKNR